MTSVLVEDSLVDDPLWNLDGPTDDELAAIEATEGEVIDAGVDVVDVASALARAQDDNAHPVVLTELRRLLCLAKARLAALTGCLPAWGWS